MAGWEEGVRGQFTGPSEFQDLLSYVTDIAVTMGSLLRAFSVTDEGGVGRGWGPGGAGALALRFQGAGGEVAPEGLAAALALTFEASIPILERVVLEGKVRGIRAVKVSLAVR